MKRLRGTQAPSRIEVGVGDLAWVLSIDGREKPWPALVDSVIPGGVTVFYLNSTDTDEILEKEGRIFQFVPNWHKMHALAATIEHVPFEWDGAVTDACYRLAAARGLENDAEAMRVAPWRHSRRLRAFVSLLGLDTAPQSEATISPPRGDGLAMKRLRAAAAAAAGGGGATGRVSSASLLGNETSRDASPCLDTVSGGRREATCGTGEADLARFSQPVPVVPASAKRKRGRSRAAAPRPQEEEDLSARACPLMEPPPELVDRAVPPAESPPPLTASESNTALSEILCPEHVPTPEAYFDHQAPLDDDDEEGALASPQTVAAAPSSSSSSLEKTEEVVTFTTTTLIIPEDPSTGSEALGAPPLSDTQRSPAASSAFLPDRQEDDARRPATADERAREEPRTARGSGRTEVDDPDASAQGAVPQQAPSSSASDDVLERDATPASSESPASDPPTQGPPQTLPEILPVSASASASSSSDGNKQGHEEEKEEEEEEAQDQTARGAAARDAAATTSETQAEAKTARSPGEGLAVSGAEASATREVFEVVEVRESASRPQDDQKGEEQVGPGEAAAASSRQEPSPREYYAGPPKKARMHRLGHRHKKPNSGLRSEGATEPADVNDVSPDSSVANMPLVDEDGTMPPSPRTVATAEPPSTARRRPEAASSRQPVTARGLNSPRHLAPMYVRYAADCPMFLQNLYTLLDDQVDAAMIMAWSDDGDEFVVYDAPRLRSFLCPKYFIDLKHFSNTLAMYKFDVRPQTSTVVALRHPFFRRSHPELLPRIYRTRGIRPVTKRICH